jgi:hypothetical protein
MCPHDGSPWGLPSIGRSARGGDLEWSPTQNIGKNQKMIHNYIYIHIYIYGLCNSPFLGCVSPMFDCWSPNAWLVDIVLWNSQEEPEEPPPTAMLRLDWKAGELPGCHQWDIYSEHVPPKCIQMYHGHFSVTRFGSFFIHLHFVCME